jgi:tetratricopeptide (TPR) repeat protein
MKFLVFTLIVVLGVAAYSNSLNSGFVYDDPLVVEGNSFITSLDNLSDFFNSNYYLGSGETSWRAVVTFTYFIDYAFWEFNPAGFHLTNLIFHILNALLFYFLAFHLIAFLDKNILKSKSYFSLPFISSLVFLLHPVQTEAVNSVGFRHEVVFTFFFLASLLFYLKFRSGKGRKIFVFYGASLICYFLSMAAKEMAIVLPIFILLIEFLGWLANKNRQAVLKKRVNIKSLSFKNTRSYLGFLFTLGAYVFIRFIWLVKPDEKIRGLRHGAPFLGGTLYTSILTTLRIFVSYLGLFFFPLYLSSEHMVSVSHSFFEPRVLLASLVLLVVFILIIKGFKYSPLFTLSGLWIFIPLLTVSNIIPLHHPMAERYLYLPCAGFSLFLGVFFSKIFYYKKLSKNLKKLLFFLFLILLLFYSLKTYNRNRVWKDKASFWRSEILNQPGPHRARSYSALGLTYFREGKYKEAEKWFKKSLEEDPYYTQAYNNLGLVHFKSGRYQKAIEEFEKVKAIDSSFPQIYSNSCLAYLRMNKFNQALENCKKSIELNPNLAKAYSNLGQVYLAKDDLDKAMENFETALKLNPHLARVYANIGRVHLLKDQPNQAVESYRKALEINPYLAKTRFNLALLYFQLEEYTQAEKEYKQVLDFYPQFSPACYRLAVLYYQQGKYDLAAKYTLRAERLGYRLPADFLGKMLPYLNKSNHD